jgi:hypothetical protein
LTQTNNKSPKNDWRLTYRRLLSVQSHGRKNQTALIKSVQRGLIGAISCAARLNIFQLQDDSPEGTGLEPESAAPTAPRPKVQLNLEVPKNAPIRFTHEVLNRQRK